jgi:tRNA(fMet)-specific endonuclease VapC
MMRNPLGQLAQKIDATDNTDLCTSIIVACELRFGAEKRGSKKLSEWVEITLEEFDVQPFSEDADRHYALLRTALEHKGTPIGQHDMLIAAHALALDATLVTDNTREFSRIEGLRLENWLR